MVTGSVSPLAGVVCSSAVPDGDALPAGDTPPATPHHSPAELATTDRRAAGDVAEMPSLVPTPESTTSVEYEKYGATNTATLGSAKASWVPTAVE